jgi:desulfoferrodoxin (superoxide reductase-like protein)
MLQIKQIVCTLTILMSLIMTADLFADKSSVEIIVPESAVKGTEITIKIQVTHSANSGFHHTEWAYVKVNGQEIARWKSPFESAVFTREVKYIINGPVDIEAMASCNLHGSDGAKTAKINIK